MRFIIAPVSLPVAGRSTHFRRCSLYSDLMTKFGETFHRRTLPDECVPFSSHEGRILFVESLKSNGLEGYTHELF
jgi:hypothetical protein